MAAGTIGLPHGFLLVQLSRQGGTVTRTAHRPEYADVPDGRDLVEPDPHWAEAQLASTLPRSYLPTAMPGQQHGWRKAAVWVLIVLMVSAASGGVCLTYGPDELFALFRS